MTKWTLHTDESGGFEGGLPNGYGFIVAVLAPAIPPEGLGVLQAGLDVVRDEFGVLHGSEIAGDRDAKDRYARRVIEAWTMALAAHAPAPVPRVIVLVHEQDRTDSARRDPLQGPAFAANRYLRMLLDLLQQILAVGPWLQPGDDIALSLASRVFPTREADLEQLIAYGYKRVDTAKDVIVNVGYRESLRPALQATFLASSLSPIAHMSALEVASVKKSGDPRFVVADAVSNYLWRRRDQLAEADVGGAVGLGPLSIEVLWHGFRLASLTAAAEALARDDLHGALEAMGALEQPRGHEVLVRRVLEGVLARASEGLSLPLVDRLLGHADAVLEHRRYELLAQVDNIAHACARAVANDPVRLARTNVLRGTVANHRGDVHGARLAFSEAADRLGQAPPTLSGFLERLEIENRAAVSDLNAFAFEQVARRIGGHFDMTERLVEGLFDGAMCEPAVGKLAGTLAQAAAHLGDWPLADRYFALATKHLGEDHMQAAFRAHAAIARGDRDVAITEAIDALGSSHGRHGYDREVGQDRLGRPAETFSRAFFGRDGTPFDAWLVAKLAANGWISARGLTEGMANALDEDQSFTHHPRILIHLSVGRCLRNAGEDKRAAFVWDRALERTRGVGQTLQLLRPQLAAELALRDRVDRWSAVAGEILRAGLEGLPDARGWFEGVVAPLLEARNSEGGPAAIARLQTRYSFLYA